MSVNTGISSSCISATQKIPMDLLARAVVAKFKSLNPSEIAALDKKEQTRNRQAQIRRSRAQERKNLKEEKDREKEIAKALAKEEREGDRKSAGKRDRKSVGKSAVVLNMINFNLIITQWGFQRITKTTNSFKKS